MPQISAQQNLAGYWQGVAYQPIGGSTDCYPVTIYLAQSGNQLSGTSYTYVEGTPYFAEMAAEGTLNGNVLQYEETEITDKEDAPGFEWCLGYGNLTYNAATQTLKGTLHGVTESGWPCEDAILEVYRLQILSPLVYCSPGTYTVSVQGQSIRWYSDAGLNNLIGAGNSLTRNIQQTTTFYVTQTTQYCSTPSPAAEVQVIVSDLALGAAIVQQANCKAPGSLSIAASGGKAPYQFSINSGAFQPSGTFLNLAPGAYTVTVRDGNGCERAQNITIEMPPPPTVVADANPADCAAANGMATALPSGQAPFSFRWDNGATTQTIDNLSVGTYSVTVTDANGCTASSSISVENAGNAPTLSPAATTTTCGEANGQIEVGVVGGTAPYQFKWSNGASDAQMSGAAAGTYSLTVTDANGCSNIASVEVGNSTGLDLFFVSDTVKILPGTSATLTLKSNRDDLSNGVFTWLPATNLSCSDCPNPVATPSETTLYAVSVEDADGCTSTASVVVFIEKPAETHVYIPNVFSPDGNGLNDEFNPVLSEGLTYGKMQIYDRWGELIFESDSPDKAWDGTFKGKTLAMEVFIYVFTYSENWDKTEKRISGDVMVAR